MKTKTKLKLIITIAGLLISVEIIVKKSRSPQTPTSSDSVITIHNRTQNSNTSQQLRKSKKNVKPIVPVTRLLVNPNKKVSYSSMQKAIQNLPKKLAPADVVALRHLLNQPTEAFPKRLRPIEVNSIKNDILDKLLRQKTLPSGIGQQLADMSKNRKNDPVWRDYSIQYMPQYYERATQDPSIREEERTQIREALIAALDERDGTLAGTALIALELLSKKDQTFNRKIILETGVDIANDETASTSSRLTALRVTAKEGDPNAIIDTARTLAQTGETVLLRSAALVTLGEIGNSNDQELIESYLQSDNKQIVAAAKIALTKLKKR